MTNLISFIFIPLTIFAVISIAYPGWLYYKKYRTLRVRGITEEAKPKFEARLKINFWWEIIPLGLLAAIFLLTRFYYPQLPTRIPTHFNLNGVADGWGSRGSLYGLFGGMVGLYLLLEISKLGVCKFSVNKFGVDYYVSLTLFTISIILLFASMQLGTIYYALGRIQSLNTMIKIPVIILGLTLVYLIVDVIKKSIIIEKTRRKE